MLNEPDLCVQWFEEKLQEVESTDQYFRKLQALVESLVVHRKGLCSRISSPLEPTELNGAQTEVLLISWKHR